MSMSRICSSGQVHFFLKIEEISNWDIPANEAKGINNLSMLLQQRTDCDTVSARVSTPSLMSYGVMLTVGLDVFGTLLGV